MSPELKAIHLWIRDDLGVAAQFSITPRQIDLLLARLASTVEVGAGEEDAAGVAEREVGRWVYNRISRLMDAKAGTPEAAELQYLAAVAESVEEYGEDACADHALADFAAPTLPAPDPEEVARIIDPTAWNPMTGHVPVQRQADSLAKADAILARLQPGEREWERG